MSDPSLALQSAIEAALRDSPEVKAAMGLATVRLYTLSAPNAAPYPFLTIGDDQILGDETECAASSECFTNVHVWARSTTPTESRAQAKRIASAVRAALSGLTVITGFDLVLVEFETTRHLTDPDGLTAHSVVEHRFLLDPV